jgi:hypothetical protein
MFDALAAKGPLSGLSIFDGAAETTVTPMSRGFGERMQ